MTNPASLAAQFAALADPVRVEIVAALTYRRRPVSTADLTKIAQTRSVAGHLKILCDAGWIEQVGPDARTKTLWQVRQADEDQNAPVAVWGNEDDPTDDEPMAATRMLNRASTYRRIAKMRTFDEEVETGRHWSDEWAENAVGRDYLIRLSPEQLRRGEQRLAAVMDEIKQQGIRNQDEDVEGTEATMVIICGFPVKLGDEK